MKKLLTVTLVMVFVLGLMSGVAGAFPEDGSVGQPFDEETLEGIGALSDVTRVHFCECDDGWYLIMPFRGDFGGGPYLDDGWVINVWTDREGNAWVYIFVHESDPRHTACIPEILYL